MLSGPFIGILFLNMNCMQSVGKPMPATILSILRQGVLLIPLLYLLQAVAGINGVIYGQSITDYIAIILSIIIWKKIQ
jgi:Na+-driven multidrug efflux pump